MRKYVSSITIFFFFFIIFTTYFSHVLYAHPVIWKGGTVISSKISSSFNDIKSHYSISNKWAVGIHGIQFKSGKKYFMIQNNNLLNRWNSRGSQGNIYVFTGVGLMASKSNAKSIDNLVHFGIQADWETQNIYTQLNIHSYLKQAPLLFISGRVGIVPYVGSYDDLHTWLILQIDQRSSRSHSVSTAMPVIRLFKDNYLFEFGGDLKKNYLLTAMLHF